MRKWILKIHLWIGLVSAAFLIVMGLSGAIIAFENDYDHWFSSQPLVRDAATAANFTTGFG